MPEILTKCKKHGELTREDVHLMGKKESGKQRYKCKICQKKSNHNNYMKHKDKIIKRTIEWRKDNPEKCKLYQRINKARHRDALDTSYIKNLLVHFDGWHPENVTEEVIEAKRAVLKVRRKIRELKDA
jgi:hypothetical protein